VSIRAHPSIIRSRSYSIKPKPTHDKISNNITKLENTVITLAITYATRQSNATKYTTNSLLVDTLLPSTTGWLETNCRNAAKTLLETIKCVSNIYIYTSHDKNGSRRKRDRPSSNTFAIIACEWCELEHRMNSTLYTGMTVHGRGSLQRNDVIIRYTRARHRDGSLHFVQQSCGRLSWLNCQLSSAR